MENNQRKQKITPFLWFDNQAEEAAEFYTTVFRNSAINSIVPYTSEGQDMHRQPEGSVMTVDFQLGDQHFTALNGGPLFKFTPAMSFFVICETEAEVNELWLALSEDGTILMDIGKYDWSERYGWVQDRFGVSWQISIGKMEIVGQKITPTFLFVGDLAGRAESAIHFYTSVFENSEIDGILHYGPFEQQPEGMVKHAQYSLEGSKFMIMDSSLDHSFAFNESVSFVIHCRSQDEVDHFWEKLSQGGDPEAQQCGWLKDKFGVSWQVVPQILQQLLSDADKEKVKRVTAVMLEMKKLDTTKLMQAYDQSVDATS